uniref:Cyclic nucleotide-binding domain-containing protein n=1 Tax=Panagrolaimus sp. JU765 TaxID=591449 RepID=A0AC34RIG6_9BILA
MEPSNFRKHSRIISAPHRRRSDARIDEQNMEQYVMQSMSSVTQLPNESTVPNEIPKLVLDTESTSEDIEALQKRRLSNLKFQNIVRKRLLVPMNDVNRTPDENNILSPLSPLDTTKPHSSSNGDVLTVQNGPVFNFSSSKGAKFANIAKSITLLNKRSKVGDIHGTQEHADFFNKFGMTTNPAPNLLPTDVPQGNRFKYFIDHFVVDPSDDYFYYWLWIVTIVYMYNLLFVPFRCVFLDSSVSFVWRLAFFVIDLTADSVYFADLFVRSRTGFLEQGLLVTDIKKIRKNYKKTRRFRVDIFCLLPFDYVLEFVLDSPKPVLRFNRLAKLDRVQSFISATETRIRIPNAFRVFCVVAYIMVLIHWNGCIYFLVSSTIGLGSDSWVYGAKNFQSLPSGVDDTLYRRYVYSFYWSTLILTTIGEVPGPVHNAEFAFVTMDLMCGVLIFATIVGNVGSMISNMSAARNEFQAKVDGIKQYMDLRKVSKHLEIRVIKWFDYLWANKQSLTDQQVLHVLPDKLQAEIAMHVHFETLRKVRIFQDCEAGLLAELVLKLELQVFSPGDYVCRKGDIGREMYIVKRGKLEVLADDGQTTLATLQEGAVFGELSILNIAGSKQGNRRSANIRSIGYSDLFALSKDNLWEALREYPDARRMLIQKGRDILKKDNLLDENAPEEHKTAEEIALELQSHMSLLQTKMAKLLAEQTNQNAKLVRRIDWLEKKLAKYEKINIHRDADGNLCFYNDAEEVFLD